MSPLLITLIVAAVVVCILIYLLPQTICPECKAPLPKVVIGKGNKPGLTFQGWICPKCGCEVDRMGNKIGQSHTKKPDAT
jgi:hypothetical protein